MGGAAPGDGDPLTGAAALSTNGSVQGRGSDQSGAEGRAGLGSTWRPEFSPSAAVGETVSVPGLRRPLSHWYPGHDGDKSESREETVASLHNGGLV